MTLLETVYWCPTPKPKPAPQQKEAAHHKGTMINTEMWHQCLGHIGLQKLKATSKCTKGMDNVGNTHPLFQCQACDMAKMTKVPKTKKEDQVTTPGKRFHMDFGFVWGPKDLQRIIHNKRTPKHKTAKSNHQPLLISHNGYSSYLLVVDVATCFIWIFLTKSKEPPFTTLQLFLKKHKRETPDPTYIRTN